MDRHIKRREMNTKGKTRTAAGRPGDAEKTSRQRSVIRLSDYISALIWWRRNKLILLKPSDSLAQHLDGAKSQQEGD